MTITFSEAELEALEVLTNAAFVVEPGTRCPMCHRRANKPRTDDSPPVKEVRMRGPVERVEAAEEALDILQEFTRVDPYSYPRLTLVEALVALGAQNREILKAYFENANETTYGEGS